MRPILLRLVTVATPLAQTLRQQADRAGVLVSAPLRPDQFSEVRYASTLAREFNLLEAENDMKWAALHLIRSPSTSPKQVSRLRPRPCMKVRGHTLVWERSNPPWLTDEQFNPEQLSVSIAGTQRTRRIELSWKDFRLGCPQ